MTEIPDHPLCPIRSFLQYLSKLHPRNEYLWQWPKKKEHCTDMDIWCYNKRVGNNHLAGFLSCLSHEADLSRIYTNHSIRVIAATFLKCANFSDNQIMSITGHKSISSLSLYEKVSTEEKLTMGKAMNQLLSATTNDMPALEPAAPQTPAETKQLVPADPPPLQSKTSLKMTRTCWPGSQKTLETLRSKLLCPRCLHSNCHQQTLLCQLLANSPHSTTAKLDKSTSTSTKIEGTMQLNCGLVDGNEMWTETDNGLELWDTEKKQCSVCFLIGRNTFFQWQMWFTLYQNSSYCDFFQPFAKYPFHVKKKIKIQLWKTCLYPPERKANRKRRHNRCTTQASLYTMCVPLGLRCSVVFSLRALLAVYLARRLCICTFTLTVLLLKYSH